jgi:hypothetical protein
MDRLDARCLPPPAWVITVGELGGESLLHHQHVRVGALQQRSTGPADAPHRRVGS